MKECKALNKVSIPFFSLQAGEVQLGILKLLKGTKLRSQQEEFSFDYHEHAPYDVVSTAWLSQEEMLKIHQCADAVEKFWNSGVCRDVLRLVLEKTGIQVPFDVYGFRKRV